MSDQNQLLCAVLYTLLRRTGQTSITLSEADIDALPDEAFLALSTQGQDLTITLVEQERTLQ